MLEKFQRWWVDLQHDAFFRSDLSQSVRAIKKRWSGEVAHLVGRRTINELINHVKPLVHRMRELHFPEAPTVVQSDGMWVTIQGQEEEITPDKRHERSGKHVVILVAMGFWPDGRREILDWQVAKREDHAQGERFLMRLKERGVEAKQGLKMIGRDGCGGLGKALVNVDGNSLLDQRCIFHNLQNVADKASTNLKGKAQRQAKKEPMEQAASMYQAEHAEMARERLRDWAPP